MNDKKPVPPALAQFALDKLTTKAPVKSLYVEVLRDEYEGLRARVAELEAELALSNECLDMANENYAALKAQPSGVVLPEREAVIRKAVGMCNRIPGSTTWNAAEYAYDELVARLNPCRAQSVQRCQCCGYLVTETEHRGCLRSSAVAVPDGLMITGEGVEHLKHARRELVRMDRAPLRIRQALAEKIAAMIASRPPSTGCDTCHGQGEVCYGEMAYQGHLQPPEPVMEVCPECSGESAAPPATGVIVPLDRHAIGQAASDWLTENDPGGLDWCDSRNVDALIDALLAQSQEVEL